MIDKKGKIFVNKPKLLVKINWLKLIWELNINVVREIALYLYEKIAIICIYLIRAKFATLFDSKAPQIQ